MSTTSATPTTVLQQVPRGGALAVGAANRVLPSPPAAVLVGCLLGAAAFVADAASGEGKLGIIGVAVTAVALALALAQAVRARVGRPWRASRRAAAAGTAASLFVAAFLSSVGVLERMGPQVTDSAVFAAGVAVMSVVLLIVLPLALVVFSWGVWQDRRLGWRMRVLPSVFVLVVAASAAIVAVTDGNAERWLQAAAVAVAGAVLTTFSAGLARVGSSEGGVHDSSAARR